MPFRDRASLWLRCMGWALPGRTITTSTLSAAPSAERALPACCPRRASVRDTTPWARHTFCTWTTGRDWRIPGHCSCPGQGRCSFALECIHVCMYVCMYVGDTFICISKKIIPQSLMHTFVYAYMYVCMYVCTHT